MNQQKVWDKIAVKWNEYKVKRNNLADKFLKGKNTKKVLDLGCGSGRNFIKTNATIYAVDFSREMLKFAKQKADKLKINAKLVHAKSTKLPFKDNFFDSAIAVAVFHCIRWKYMRKKAIREFYRVLKPQGQALVTVWDKNAKRFRNKPKNFKVPWTINGKKIYRYYYLYDKDEFKKELENVGFKIVKKIETSSNIILIVEKV